MAKGKKKKNKNTDPLNYKTEMFRQFQAQYFDNYNGYWDCKECGVLNLIDNEWDQNTPYIQEYNWTCTECSCPQTFYFFTYNCIHQFPIQQ